MLLLDHKFIYYSMNYVISLFLCHVHPLFGKCKTADEVLCLCPTRLPDLTKKKNYIETSHKLGQHQTSHTLFICRDF